MIVKLTKALFKLYIWDRPLISNILWIFFKKLNKEWRGDYPVCCLLPIHPTSSIHLFTNLSIYSFIHLSIHSSVSDLCDSLFRPSITYNFFMWPHNKLRLRTLSSWLISRKKFRPSVQWSLSRWICTSWGTCWYTKRGNKTSSRCKGFWVCYFEEIINESDTAKGGRGGLKIFDNLKIKGCHSIQCFKKYPGPCILLCCMQEGAKLLHFWVEWSNAKVCEFLQHVEKLENVLEEKSDGSGATSTTTAGPRLRNTRTL